jgi:iron complex transport system ATP-binding protein
MLEVRDLRFAYNGADVFSGVDFAVAPGAVLGVLGPNGAGKSTLLRCVLHLLRPRAGEVLVDGRASAAMGPRERAALLAYVPQARPLKLPLTVFEAVLMGRRPHMAWRPSAHDLERADAAIRALGLAALAGRDFDALSGGQGQKVLLARAFAQEARYLLLDEPTSSLDLRHQEEVLGLVAETARERAVGALVAIHDLNAALRFCDAVLVLHQGGVAACGAPDDVLSARTVREVYGVDVVEVDCAGRRAFLPAGPPAPRAAETDAMRGGGTPCGNVALRGDGADVPAPSRDACGGAPRDPGARAERDRSYTNP